MSNVGLSIDDRQRSFAKLENHITIVVINVPITINLYFTCAK